MFGLICLSLSAAFSIASQDPVSVTILHTNDLHSQFRPQKDVIGLGGIARLKTAVDRIRIEEANTLLVDGGDWSEGQIYYTLNQGADIIRMMEHIGYDAAVVGNHDWINGPDQLLNMYKSGRANMTLLAANIDLTRYSRKEEFRKAFLPYSIYSRGGMKVAVIGLVTYEFIYDSFFGPVRIVSPLPIIRELAANLRNQVDTIIVLSHNGIRMNEEILRTSPDVDLVIAAHDHKKLNTPRIVLRGPSQNPGWIVETGCWGRYLGRVDIKIRKRSEADDLGIPSTELSRYQLIQIDSTIPENPETAQMVDQLEQQIEKNYGGPIFHDHVAHSEFEVRREGFENLMGNLATDSYLQASPHADLALDQIDLIYGQLYSGNLSTADFFASNPAIYSFDTKKTWTLQTLRLKGSTIRWMINLLFAAKPVAGFGPMSAAGLSFTYGTTPTPKPSSQPQSISTPGSFSPFIAQDRDDNVSIKDIQIRGAPLDPTRFYTMATGGGMLYGIQFINSLLPGAIRIHDQKDSGVESWRVILDYVARRSPFKPAQIELGNRIRSESQDLGFMPYDVQSQVISSTQDYAHVKARVTVHNFGLTASTRSSSTVHFYSNRNGTNFAQEPDWVEVGTPTRISEMMSRGQVTVDQDFRLFGDHGIYPLRVVILGEAEQELNLSNNETVVMIRAANP